MKRQYVILLVILAVIICVGTAFGAWLLLKPINEPLALETPTIVEVESPTATSPAQNDRLCNASGVMKIMETGIASPLAIGHEGADAVRLVVVDYDQGTAGILALPADLWVETPEDLVADLGDTAPLNLIYFTAYENATGNSDQVRTQKATQVLAQTIYDVFGFLPDKYITINGDAFIELVDTLGGIPVTLAAEIDATAENYGVFPVGLQTLDGEQTLNFVRMLYPNGVGPDTFGRLERQNMVIQSLMDTLLSPSNWVDAPEIIMDARKLVVTDLSVNQATQLGCMIEEVGEDAQVLIVDDTMVSFDDQGRMIPDVGAVQKLISMLEGN